MAETVRHRSSHLQSIRRLILWATTQQEHKPSILAKADPKLVAVHAPYLADNMRMTDSVILENECLATDTFRVRIEAPHIAGLVQPGQFVMLRMTNVNAPLIGRAFAVYDVVVDLNQKRSAIDLVYLRKGALTTPLSAAPVGTPVQLWGPLGNRFDMSPCRELVMAVGGIGQTPMLMVGREALSNFADKVTLIYGARRHDLLAGVDQFRDAGFDVRVCTDDGSMGEKARVPDVLAQLLDQKTGEIGNGETDERPSVRVVTCGPEPMMEAVANLCMARSVPCQVSMETPMACGIGICFSCVAKVRLPEPKDGDCEWDYKRTCVEGPIFDAEKIVWD